MDVTASILITVITAATPLLLAAAGELVTERSGVLNLGVEGMMLTGAVCAFVAVHETGSHLAGVAAGALGAMGLAALFAAVALGLLANQVATGLALTILGTGLSALIGREYVGQPVPGLPVLEVPLLSRIPFLGPVLFARDPLVYLSLGSVAALAWILYRTRLGLVLRAVGESHDAAHALGYRVLRVRTLAVLFGGMMAGLAGAYLSLAYTPMWAENMTAGRGWIALALVVFGTWRPWRVAAGAYLFGGVTIAQLHVQALGIHAPSQILSMLPYLATILVLVLISADERRIRLNAPASLGKVFVPRG